MGSGLIGSRTGAMTGSGAVGSGLTGSRTGSGLPRPGASSGRGSGVLGFVAGAIAGSGEGLLGSPEAMGSWVIPLKRVSGGMVSQLRLGLHAGFHAMDEHISNT